MTNCDGKPMETIEVYDQMYRVSHNYRVFIVWPTPWGGTQLIECSEQFATRVLEEYTKGSN